ncbi:aspartyl protease family protein [Hyalangium rubrum]|uniref:Aspartyl protease family protein n=1 Tax=Hyalangium rubrum TaxID=3103134 RepID=A0ABU5GUG1_9BACT|nr:aspartyl protease family protein [Hyalangium sp. s54d21]MDY7224811.1 aspartyl protease family protein [Hyalangium sp. s54d21]
MRRAAALLAALAMGACGDPECPAVPVTLPSASTSLPWVADAPPGTVLTRVGEREVPLLLDTGFPRTSLSISTLAGQDNTRARLELGPVRAGPFRVEPLLAPLGLQGIVGADVLSRLPLSFEPRRREVVLHPAFAPDAAGTPLDVVTPPRCQDKSLPLLLVSGTVEGEAATFVLDTGATGTFLRSSRTEALSSRARLEGIRLQTGFAGLTQASAVRARSLSVGAAETHGTPLLFASAVDAQLDRLEAEMTAACGEGCKPRALDGFLGWSFLREFRVGLTGGASASEARTLGLSRLEAQDHWQRDYVGVGLVFQPSDSPLGLRVEGFLSPSPAREAGIEAGDILVAVDDTPIAQAPSPWAPPGTSVQVTLERAGQTRTVTLEVRDLLPDPP